MTDIDLDAIEACANAATDGPWDLLTDTCDCGEGYGCPHGEYPIGFGPFPSVEHIGTEQAHADHEFVAHARADVPQMATEIRTQQQSIRQLIDFRNATVAERQELANRLKAVREFAEKAQRNAGFVDAADLLRVLGDPHPAESRPPVVFDTDGQ